MTESSTDIYQRKTQLRQRIIAKRDALDESTRQQSSARIVQRVVALREWQQARCVLAYASFGSELNTSALLENVLVSKKKLVLPRVDRAAKKLRLYLVTDLSTDLKPGVFGIREPDAARCSEASLNEIDFVLTPGVAFTPRGERLGYGAGYYDKLIASFAHAPALVAAAFSFQVIDALPMTSTDKQVHKIVTEDAVYPSTDQAV